MKDLERPGHDMREKQSRMPDSSLLKPTGHDVSEKDFTEDRRADLSDSEWPLLTFFDFN